MHFEDGFHLVVKRDCPTCTLIEPEIRKLVESGDFGQNIRIYPNVTAQNPRKLFMRVRFFQDPLSPSFQDDTIQGVSNLSDVPFGNLEYTNINSIGRQWIRQYVLALSKEQLGLIRSKFSNVPIPGSELQLNGVSLVDQGREDKKQMIQQLKDMLETLTYDKLMETASSRAESIQKQLKHIPLPNGYAIIMG